MPRTSQYFSCSTIHYFEIDFIKGLPTTDDDLSCICAITDSFTRYMILFACATESAEVVQKCLMEVYTKYGCPQALRSDGGPGFIAQGTRDICKLLELPQIITLAHHPQGHGQIENSHQKTINLLRILVSQRMHAENTNWDLYLPVVGHVINSTISSVTGFAPFSLMFGSEAVEAHQLLQKLPSTIGSIVYPAPLTLSFNPQPI